MGNIEDLIKRNNRYGKNAVAALIAGTMAASSVVAPISAYAQVQDLEDKPIEQNESADNNSSTDSSSSNSVVAPDPVPTPTPAPTPEVVPTPEVTPEVTPEENPSITPDATPEENVVTPEDGVVSPDENVVAPEEGNENTENSQYGQVESNPEVTPEDETEDNIENNIVDENIQSNDKNNDSSQNVENNSSNNTTSENNTPTQTTFASPSAESTNKISNSASTISPSYNYTKDQTYVSHHYTEDMTTSSFVAAIGENARQIGQERDLYASVMIAQAILESGSGTSQLSQAPNNNLFGIKGVWHDEDGVGHKASFKTLEDDGTGTMYQVVSDFRAYDTIADSMEDYADLLHDTENGMGNYYSRTWKSNTDSYKDACYALQGTYATDTSYASKLINLIETYDLDRFDEKLDYEISGNIYDPESELSNEDGYRELTMKDYANLQAIATSQLGTDYVWGGETPEDGFDCSGLVKYVYKEALGIDITRTTYTQQYQGEEIPLDDAELRMGDLVFFTDGGDVHHVGMYLGDGFYIHAPKPGDEVSITSMDDYTPDFAKRIVDFKTLKEA